MRPVHVPAIERDHHRGRVQPHRLGSLPLPLQHFQRQRVVRHPKQDRARVQVRERVQVVPSASGDHLPHPLAVHQHPIQVPLQPALEAALLLSATCSTQSVKPPMNSR